MRRLKSSCAYSAAAACEPLEECFEVLEEQWLVLVDQQAGGGVARLRDHDPFQQASLADLA